MWSDRGQSIGRRIFELELPAASIVIPIVCKRAVCRVLCARHVVVHANMHVTMFMRLRERAMWTVVVVVRLIRHRTGLQRQIQPHGHKQAQGVSAPDLSGLSDAAEVAQVLVSLTILQYRAIPGLTLLPTLPMRQVQGSRQSDLKWPLPVGHGNYAVRIINIDKRICIGWQSLEHVPCQALEVHDKALHFRRIQARCC